MLHLAKVQKNANSGKMELQLLAHRGANDVWQVGNNEAVTLPEESELDDSSPTKEGLLVLVELDENGQVFSIQEAQHWILGLIEKYLTHNHAPGQWLKEEEAKVEKWRQELTLKSQDLTRRNLEIETRQEQIQELEESLKREKEQLKKDEE